ncbi:glycosyltransferase family 4 protein [Agrobacterium rubi]|uniref:hypothetical protein n=1 Tax=Agrobacterium rubi TaxID=28099 RepID=UPI0015747548|nr:hypothetical protein [Agrobacterium rubi]NTF11063.1 glycosyltransferase family 4 protein [Agrobacterium rubi]NTF23436.1 glycosyltransferase family 4 protein [Agrobacterium rubi]NTF30389.1 glycosyltransferase family 4 protein [Agrobacterium rubi]
MIPSSWRNYFTKLLPQPRLRNSAVNAARKPVRRIYLFGRHPNPTADYYFEGRFADDPRHPYELVDIRNRDLSSLETNGALVILCRYASASVLKWIRVNQDSLAGVVLFLDDNIPAVVAGEDATLSYRIFLYYRALYPLRRLNTVLDAVWVSTRALGDTMRHLAPVVVPPAPPSRLWQVNKPRGDKRDVCIAYHATGVHYSEHLFLHPIIESILIQRPQTRFEVFAGKHAAKIWKDMEGVTVRPPVSWSEYLEESSKRLIDIMLVPLTPSLVNDCRAPTKRIDVARFGAAGVFSISKAYGGSENTSEILLPYQASVWTETILNLIDDTDLRAKVAAATRAKVAAMRSAVSEREIIKLLKIEAQRW